LQKTGIRILKRLRMVRTSLTGIQVGLNALAVSYINLRRRCKKIRVSGGVGLRGGMKNRGEDWKGVGKRLQKLEYPIFPAKKVDGSYRLRGHKIGLGVPEFSYK